MPRRNIFINDGRRPLDEARKVAKIRVDVVSTFIPGYQNLLPGHLRRPEENVEKWYDDSVVEWTNMEANHAKKIKEDETYTEKALKIMKNSKLAYQRTESSLKDIKLIDDLEDEADRRSNVEVLDALKAMIELEGEEVIVSTLNRLVTSDGNKLQLSTPPAAANSSTPQIVSASQKSKSEPHIDPRIINACIKYLGATEVMPHTVESVCGCMEFAHKKMLDLERKKVAAASLPNEAGIQAQMEIRREIQRQESIVQASPRRGKNQPMSFIDLVTPVKSGRLSNLSGPVSTPINSGRLSKIAGPVATPVNSRRLSKIEPPVSSPEVIMSVEEEGDSSDSDTSSSDSESSSQEESSTPDESMIIDTSATKKLEEDIGRLEEEKARLEQEMAEVQAKVESLTLENEDQATSINTFKCRFIHNKNYCHQITTEESIEYFNDLQEYEDLKDRRIIKFDIGTYPLTLADKIVGAMFEPHLPAKEYVFLLFTGLCRDFTEAWQIEYAQEQGQHHMLWISSKLASIIDACSDKMTNRFFTHWMENMINFCPIKGIGRTAMFMIIGNISYRSPEEKDKKDSIWWTAHNMILMKKMGVTFDEWDVMELAAFYYFMCSGPSDNPLLDRITKASSRAFQIVQSLRDGVFCDFIGFMKSPCIEELIKRSPTTTTFESEGDGRTIYIVRSSAGHGDDGTNEYIWVKDETHLIFFPNGVEIEFRPRYHNITLFQMRPKGSTYWFTYPSDEDVDLSYFERYHKDDLDIAMALFKQGDLEGLEIE